MLKPNAIKTAKHQELSALVSEFLKSGRSITKGHVAVAQNLRKRKYIGKKALVGVAER